MMQSVQVSIADHSYASIVLEAISRSCAWHVDAVDRPDPSQQCVLVLDELAFARLAFPLSNPERVVLITRQDPQDPRLLSHAWEAGIVSVVSESDPISTVLLAIMAAALRVAKSHGEMVVSGISPSSGKGPAPIAPQDRHSSSKRCKIQ
jgi:hypothetical protein